MRISRATWAAILPAAAVSLVAAASAFADAPNPVAPDPIGPPSQSLADGCQRNIPGLLSESSPEWVYVHSYDPQFVNPDNTYVAEGVAHHTHPAEDDLPQGHQSFDLNFDLTVDPQYQYLLAGDQNKIPPGSDVPGTGNYAPGDGEGALHMEWESEAIPQWAWPTENDRIKVWGSWIWDCGHWGEGFPDYFVPSQLPYNGPVTGERTEFHSLKAIVVMRDNPSSTPSNETQADVFASTDGRRAHAQEQCAHEHPAPAGSDSYGADYTACVQDPSKQRQTLDDSNTDYSFFVPAPPKPSSGATLTYRIVDREAGGPTETVTPAANGINVTINFKDSSAQAYGKTFYVGWSKKTAADHLRVTVNSIKVNRSLDPNPTRQTQSGTPPGEYNLYLDANGTWQFLNEFAPGLLAVSDGQTFTVNKGVDFYVQSGKPVRIFFTGRECDFVGVNPCPQTSELSDENDRPGSITETFSSASAAVKAGRHTVQSDKATPSATDPNVVPNYSVTYTVSRVPG